MAKGDGRLSKAKGKSKKEKVKARTEQEAQPNKRILVGAVVENAKSSSARQAGTLGSS
jgi:hypothetical protein